MSQENTTILLDAAFLTSSQYLSEIDLWPFFSTARDRGKIKQFCSSYNFVGQMSDQKLDIPLNAYIKTSLRGGRCDRRSNLYHETEIATVEATPRNDNLLYVIHGELCPNGCHCPVGATPRGDPRRT